MKILFCPHNYPPTPGGVSTFSSGIVESLREKGHDVIVIYDSSVVKKKDRIENVHYFFNVDIVYLKVLIKIFHVLWACMFFKPDIVFCTEWKAYGIGAHIAKKLFNIKYFIQVHGTEIFTLKSRSFEFILAKRILNYAEKIFPNSGYTAQLLTRFGCNVRKIFIFHPGIYDLKAKQKSNKHTDEIVIFTAARLIYRKGIDLCIKALSKISYNNWKYYIAGDGPYEKELKTLTQKLNLDKKIIFLGDVANKDINIYFAFCDIFLLTSRLTNSLESFGIVYLEANIQGKPVIASAVGGVSDAVVDSETGFLIKENNIEQLKEKIELLMEDEKLRNELGQKGRDRAVKKFLWENHIDALIDKLTN